MALDVILNRYASGDSGDTHSNTEKEEQENEMRKVKLDKAIVVLDLLSLYKK